jgi:Cu-processing system permease protein
LCIEHYGAIIHHTSEVYVRIITSWIIPPDYGWRRAAYEMQTPLAGVLGMSPFAATSVPSLLMVIYAILYLLVALILSIRIFQRRDL